MAAVVVVARAGRNQVVEAAVPAAAAPAAVCPERLAARAVVVVQMRRMATSQRHSR